MDSHTQNDVATLFLSYSSRKLGQMTATLESCLHRLTDDQVWQRGGEHENAIGNLILHLSGNMRQWIMFGVDRQPDVRVRDAEFSATGGMGAEQLLTLFRTTTAEARAVIKALPAERLTEITNPQHGEVSVLDAIYQVVGHVQQHVGQIILLTKQMAGTDLDLSMPRPR
jgi:uncharacterized damage-inducible protein DinB